MRGADEKQGEVFSYIPIGQAGQHSAAGEGARGKEGELVVPVIGHGGQSGASSETDSSGVGRGRRVCGEAQEPRKEERDSEKNGRLARKNSNSKSGEHKPPIFSAACSAAT